MKAVYKHKPSDISQIIIDYRVSLKSIDPYGTAATVLLKIKTISEVYVPWKQGLSDNLPLGHNKIV